MSLDTTKAASTGDIKELRSGKVRSVMQANAKEGAAGMAKAPEDMAQIHAMLAKILEETADLKEIRRSVNSVDQKLSSLVSRITTVEDRVSTLETEQASMKANPGATKADILALTNRMAILEDRSRRNNLRFIGIPEGLEKGDTVAFLNNFISTALNVNPPPGGFEMDRAHRIGLRRETPGDARAIIARFLRFRDRQLIIEAARSKKRIMWDDNPVMIFPDFSKETQKRRETFKSCKRALHERNIKFSLLYPAQLKIFTAPPRTFEDPADAMDFIKDLGGK